MEMKVWSSRYQGTYGVNWVGKGPKPAAAYRGARRNAGRNTYNTVLRAERKALGMTRREFDRLRFTKALS